MVWVVAFSCRNALNWMVHRPALSALMDRVSVFVVAAPPAHWKAVLDEQAGVDAGVHYEGRERLLGLGKEVVVKASDDDILVAVYEVLSGPENCA
mgnify:CR=1 FL=1